MFSHPAKSLLLLLMLLLTTTLVFPEESGSSAQLTKQLVLKRHGEGAYAIPKMIVTKSGAVLIVLQDRLGGDWGAPIFPVALRSTDNGNTWQGPNPIGPPLDEKGRFHVKPTGIVEDRLNGKILVFLVRSPIRDSTGHRIDERWFYTHLAQAWRLGRAWFLVTSSDDGQTWSEPVEITDQLRQKPHWQEWSPVHSGIQLQHGPHAGRLVVPVRCYCPDPGATALDWRFQTNSLIYSDDGGTTWQGAERTGPQVGECSIAELPDGAIYVNQRIAPEGEKPGHSYVISHDGGATFDARGDLPDQQDARCHAGLISTTDPRGRSVLIFSNIPGPKRQGLTISLSYDGGLTWGNQKILESGPAAYSDLAAGTNGEIFCVYETGEKSSRRDLAFARFDWNWLLTPDN